MAPPRRTRPGREAAILGALASAGVVGFHIIGGRFGALLLEALVDASAVSLCILIACGLSLPKNQL